MLSRLFLIKQGKCCGKKCLMCPDKRKHSGKSKTIRNDVLNALEEWEKKDLNRFLKIRLKSQEM